MENPDENLATGPRSDFFRTKTGKLKFFWKSGDFRKITSGLLTIIRGTSF